MTTTIGLTDDRVNDKKFALYVEWISELGDDIRTVRLTPTDGNGATVAECDGIILTGGGDVDPALYGGDPAHPSLDGVSALRDRFEIEIFRSCIRSGTPVLGICRGLQLANVALGGTLIMDLGEEGRRGHRPPKGARCEHDVHLQPGSAMRRLFGVEYGKVVSSHHQAAAKIGTGLRVAAVSYDGVIEALESDSPGGADLLLVQWHPERSESRGDALRDGPGRFFLETISSKNKLAGN